MKKAKDIRAIMDRNGYTQAESILNEWNYLRGWTDEYVYTLEMIHGIKGAAYVMSVLSEAQKSSIDILMYYDTRPSVFNGAFDFYTLRPLKGYYPLKWYGEFYALEHEIREENHVEEVYTLCGVDKDGKVTAIVTHYSENDEKENVQIKVDFGKYAEYDIYLLDKDYDGEWVKTTSDLTFEMPVHSCIMIKEK